MNNKQIQGHEIQVEFYDKSQQHHVYVSVTDVIDNQNLKALFLRGLNKNVSP